MRRGVFLASLGALLAVPRALLGWPVRWKPVRLPAETYTSWAGPLHGLLQLRKAQMEARGGVARYFHCNQVTAVRLGEEIFGGGAFPLGEYQAFEVCGLRWVRDESEPDDEIWVHSIACLECADAGWVWVGTRKLPCPKCRPGEHALAVRVSVR